MAVQTITRGAVSVYTKTLRLPLDAATRLLGRDADAGPRAAAGLAIDQAEATVLGTFGRVLGDRELQDDATRRSRAADERRNALRLRERAEEVSQDADERIARKEQDADRKRAQARQQAQRRKEQAAKTEQSRRRTNAEVAASKREAVEERSKVERLEALEEKADALQEKEEALVVKDEARRLGNAAAKAKARRKRPSGNGRR